MRQAIIPTPCRTSPPCLPTNRLGSGLETPFPLRYPGPPPHDRPSPLRPHVPRLSLSRHSSLYNTLDRKPDAQLCPSRSISIYLFQPCACTFSRYPVNIRSDLPLLPFLFVSYHLGPLPNFDDISILSIGMTGPFHTLEAFSSFVFIMVWSLPPSTRTLSFAPLWERDYLCVTSTGRSSRCKRTISESCFIRVTYSCVA